MPQALISTWLSKPRNTAVAEAKDADPKTTLALEELSSLSKRDQGYNSANEGNTSAPQKQERQNQAVDITLITSNITDNDGQTRAQNEGIIDKPRRPEQADNEILAIHPNIFLQPLTESNMPAFKVLNTILPVAYSERFYTEILTCPVTAAITMAAIWKPALSRAAAVISNREDSSVSADCNVAGKNDCTGLLISAIRCRLLRPKPDPSTSTVPYTSNNAAKPTLYISTLATKPTYRSYGAATALLDSVVRRALSSFDICAVEAHVWDGHEDALAWYLRRGFAIIRREEGYYRRLRPTGAVLVRKMLE